MQERNETQCILIQQMHHKNTENTEMIKEFNENSVHVITGM
jgi:hypothetical protein